MTLAFVVPGLDEAASEKAIAILQNRLSQEQEAALVLKHAHWNVTGPNFIAVHEMLDPEVEAVLAQADESAERIATLGGKTTNRRLQDLSSLKQIGVQIITGDKA